MKHIAIALALLTGVPVICHAQLVESREQATGWYVPVNIKVTTDGGKARNLYVTVFKENELVQEFASKKGKFSLNLDLGSNYTFMVRQEGYQPKSIYVDTHVPANEVTYAAFPCFVNLESAEKFAHSDPFYLDFPSAIVRWNDEFKGFLPNTNYLADIQSKIGMLQAQMIPE